MKILITGGSGFVGTVLTQELIDAGHEVAILDLRVSEIFPDRTIVADIRDYEAQRKVLKGFDAVYHLASEHRDDVRPRSLYYDVNVTGAEKLVKACEANGINKLLFTSTVAVYGLNAGIPNESSDPAPFNDYGKSKHLSEQVFLKWADKSADRALTIVRPCVIFGERNRGNVYNLMTQLSSGRFLMVGNGRNQKSMAYVKNVSAFLKSCLNRGPGCSIFNYADKPDLSTNELIEIIEQAFEKKRSRPRIPYPIGLMGGYVFDAIATATGTTLPISSVRVKKFCADTRVSTTKVQECRFTPPYTLRQGLKNMIDYEFKPNITSKK